METVKSLIDTTFPNKILQGMEYEWQEVLGWILGFWPMYSQFILISNYCQHTNLREHMISNDISRGKTSTDTTMVLYPGNS